jgi:hypothetical protein
VEMGQRLPVRSVRNRWAAKNQHPACFARQRSERISTPAGRLSTRSKISRGAAETERERTSLGRENHRKTNRKSAARALQARQVFRTASVVRRRDSGGGVFEGSSSPHSAPADEGYRRKNKRRRSASAEKNQTLTHGNQNNARNHNVQRLRE